MSEAEAPGGHGMLRARWRTLLLGAVAVAGVIVAVLLIATLGAANDARDRALERQSRSYEVMILARALGGNMAEAEAALGRFVISGDKALGRRYQREWALAGRQIGRLRVAVADRSEQTGLVRELQRAYATRGRELARIALHSNYGQNNQALAGYYAARDSAALARSDRLLTRLADQERTILEERTAWAGATVAGSNRAAAWLGGFGLLLMLGAIALGWGMIEAMAARRAADAEIADERARARELEAAVAAATAELHAEAREREQAEAKLRQMQKMEAVGQLTGGIAHDFNNMLAVVLGGLELARRQTVQGGDALRHLDLATDGAHRAAALTRQLLAFARAEPLVREPIDPTQLIAGMSGLLDRTLGDAITVRTKDEGRGWHVFTDQHQLENALLNLAVNARDAMDGRGTLTLSTGSATLGSGEIGSCAAGDYATIAVADTGCGMSSEVLERVFEPFFTTKPMGKGTGLGLSQIFGFVRQSHGEIAIRSEPGEGTTVTLYLPRHLAASLPPAAPAPALPAEIAPHPGLDILVIEDDARVLAATVEALYELGHRPVACNDPAEAEAVLGAMARCDLVLTDVLMPGRTGPEIVADLRRSGWALPVLYATGFAGDIADDALAGERVLRKPFTLAALADAVDAVAEPAPEEPARRRA